LKEREAQLAKSSNSCSKLDAENEELRQKVTGLERELAHLKDEHHAMSMELCTLETKFRAKKTELDNLLDRWIKEKETQAKKMNAEMDRHETISKAQKKKALLEAATSLDVHDADLADIGTSAGGVSSIPTRMMHVSEAHTDAVTCCQFGHGKLATGSRDRTIQVYDASGNVANTLRNHTGEVTCLAFHPSTEHLVSGSADHKVFVYNLQTMRSVHTFNNHRERVTDVLYNTDGTILFTSAKDHKINMFSGTTGKYMTSADVGSTCLAMATTMGSCLVTGHFDKTVSLRDIRGDWKKTAIEIKTGHTALITGMTAHPDGNLITTSSRDNTMREIDCRMQEVVATYADPSFTVGAWGCHAAHSPDGTMLASGTDVGEVCIWMDGNISTRLSKNGHTGEVLACAWKEGGDELVTVGTDKKVIFWGN
jgi:WD40 repeat protein